MNAAVNVIKMIASKWYEPRESNVCNHLFYGTYL